MSNLQSMADKASEMAGKAAELGKEAKESMEEFGRSAGRGLEEARDQTGDALHAAASTVRSKGRQSSRAIGDITAGAADRLDATASCIEDLSLRNAAADLKKFASRNVTRCLVAAVALGFVAGTLVNRAIHRA